MDNDIKKLKKIALFLPNIIHRGNKFFFEFDEKLFVITKICFEEYELDLVYEQDCNYSFSYDGHRYMKFRFGRIRDMKLLSDEEVKSITNNISCSLISKDNDLFA